MAARIYAIRGAELELAEEQKRGKKRTERENDPSSERAFA